jgi:hypothetical protein
VSAQQAAEIQALLEGVALPAHKRDLVRYARREQAADAAAQLEKIPDREYKSLDEVGEALFPVQPPSGKAQAEIPHAESGQPPGGDAYTDPDPDTGRIQAG